MSVKVCVYAICKNEEKFVDRWYESIKDADKIVVLDTGSTDSTMEKLLNLPSPQVSVYQETITPWRFDTARTRAFSYVPDWCDVCVIADFDHIFREGWIDEIRKLFSEGYDVIKGDLYEYDENNNFISSYTSMNVHPNDKENWYWNRPVHEWLLCKKEYTEIKSSNFIIEHHPDRTKSRSQYMDILRRDYTSNYTDPSNCIYYQIELTLYGEKDEALDVINRSLEVCNFTNDRMIEYQLLINGACLYREKREFEKAFDFIHRAKEIYDKNNYSIRNFFMVYADLHFVLKNYEESILFINKALEVTENCEDWREDQYYWNGGCYAKLVECYNNLNDYEKEVYYAKKAYEENPNNEYFKSLFNKYIVSDGLLEENKMESNTEKIDGIITENGIEPYENKNKICVYAICKNEEQFVDKWCESMKEADYVVVLDTGSTDNTVQKLREHGVIVGEKIINPWRFDVARNEGMKLIPEDANILISTDLDEILEPGWADVLRNNWIEGVHERAIYKYTWSHLDNGEDGRVFQYDKIHSRNWIWKYPVHELLWNTVTQSNGYNEMNTLNLFNDIHLHHYPDKTKSRGSYLPLLELRAQEDPEDYYGLIYLAHEYYYRGFYEKSIITLNNILEKFKDISTSLEKASCYLFMGDSYMALENHAKAIDSYIKAIGIEPTYREPYINLAKVFYADNDYDLAIAYLKAALRKSYRHYTWVERDLSWTYEVYDLLCQACFYSGNKKDSILYAAKALSFEPNNERLKQNLDLCIANSDDMEII